MHSMLIGDLGTPELLIILAVVVLLFGASKLPELARGSGRALRIFKAETKGLLDGDEDNDLNTDEDLKTPEQRALDARRSAETRANDITGTHPADRRDDTTI